MGSSQYRAQAREILRTTEHRARWINASARVLPDFVVIGAQKAGTTSMYAYLGKHPDIVPAARKEIHYFDMHYSEGERWYRALFPTRRQMTAAPSSATHKLITGEASPYYLFHPLAPQRAARLIPDARLVVLLRDPVARAWSHYGHEVRAGRETLDFAAALDAEPARLAGAEAAIRAGVTNAAATYHRTASYVGRGMYAAQLRRWFEHYPRESIVVVRSEQLFADPGTEFGRVLEHLGVPPQRAPQFKVFNAGREAPLDVDVRARLDDVFREPNLELADLLGEPAH